MTPRFYFRVRTCYRNISCSLKPIICWWKSSSHTEIWQASRQYGKIDGQFSKQYEGFNIKFRGTRNLAKSCWMMSILHSVDNGPGVESVGIPRTVHKDCQKIFKIWLNCPGMSLIKYWIRCKMTCAYYVDTTVAWYRGTTPVLFCGHRRFLNMRRERRWSRWIKKTLHIGIKRLWLTPYETVITWKRFPHYWPFVKGMGRWPVNSPTPLLLLMSISVSVLIVRAEFPRKTVKMAHKTL